MHPFYVGLTFFQCRFGMVKSLLAPMGMSSAQARRGLAGFVARRPRHEGVRGTMGGTGAPSKTPTANISENTKIPTSTNQNLLYYPLS